MLILGNMNYFEFDFRY